MSRGPALYPGSGSVFHCPKVRRCLDANRNMLIENAKTMQDRCQSNASALQALADALPVTSNSLDVVLTFNAVHHFNLAEFIRESDRALKPGGLLFIYTRLRSQNKNSIWGKYFPAFHHKEDRLYEVDDFQQALRGVRRLTMERVKYFRYQRTEKFSRLTAQAAGRHYSTFEFYHAVEFERALHGFQESMKNHFDIQNGISWHDENVMFVFRKHDARPS